MRTRRIFYNSQNLRKFIVGTAFILNIFPTNVAAITNTYNSNTDCNNAEYRKNHPYKCQSFASMTMPVLGGLGLAGGTIALIGMGGGGGTSSKTSTTPQPTMTITNYNLVGADVDSAHLATATTDKSYTDNKNQYDDIRLGYSLARGYTGTGTTIAVLDSGPKHWHGNIVAKIASGPVAPNANVILYPVSTNSRDFISYKEIGNVIASAQSANVYNASWSVSMRVNDINSRSDLIRYTDANFVNQISNAATERDAIFVWAAGNDYDKSQSSALSALPLVMPEMRGHFINVVAWDSDTQELATYSNACGTTKDYCITAPGSKITSDDLVVSGTSFAAPIVSAAVAVIREAYPYMTAAEVTELLLTTARDLGEPGIDEIYGHGMLDMERATRPVGTELVSISNGSTQTLRTARVSAPIAHAIKSADIHLAYFDSFGRPFDTKMSDHIKTTNTSRAFQHLRQDKTEQKMNFGPIEMGFAQKDFLMGDGFLKTADNTTENFIGISENITAGNLTIFAATRVAKTSPRPTPESMISEISDIYTASAQIGTKISDWTFSVAINDAILYGNMNLYTPVGRASDGTILFKNQSIDLSIPGATEYLVQYKFLTTGYVDNPYGTDEVFMMLKHKLYF